MTVRHDYDPDVDFSAFSTYDWMPKLDSDKEVKSMLSGPFLGKRIKKAVVEGMAAKGFERTTQEPNFLIAYHVTYKRMSDVDVHGHGYGSYGYGYGHWGPYTEVREHTEGTLILDFVDPVSKQLIWRGWSISTLNPHRSPKEEQDNINWATAEILKRFPPY